MDTGGFKKQMHKHTDWKWTSLAMAAIITALGISYKEPTPRGLPRRLSRRRPYRECAHPESLPKGPAFPLP